MKQKLDELKKKFETKIGNMKCRIKAYFTIFKEVAKDPENKKLWKKAFIAGLAIGATKGYMQNKWVKEFLNKNGYRVYIRGMEVNPKECTYKNLKRFDRILSKTGDLCEAFSKTKIWK